MKKTLLLILLSIGMSSLAQSQSLEWEGNADNDFFNEANWLITGTANNPAEGTLNPGSSIDFNLNLTDAEILLQESAVLELSTDKSLTLMNASISLGDVESGTIILNGTSTLILHANTPLASASIQLESNKSWIKMIKVDPFDAAENYVSKVTSAGDPLIVGETLTVNQYYFRGSLLRLNDPNYKPLTLFDEQGQEGETFEVGFFDIVSREQLGVFENKASSFRLARGYMATMAVFQNGTGKSEVYIASEEALEIDLPQALNNTVSFIRVMPWNWVTKKGASKFLQVGTTWTYNWNRNGESLLNIEYAPMAWGVNGAQTAVVSEYIVKKNITHVMGFNESDNCNGQSGQFGNLCQIDVAVPLFKNLMRSGLRLVSPSPRENGPLPGRWLSEFRDLAVETDVRYDVLGVHWYDWASNPANSPFEDPEAVFERFKNYLDKVYAEHGLPIWITEFNANANRDVSVQRGFLELALPYLESLDFIERYDYFEPNPDIANNRDDITFATFFDNNGELTDFGQFYQDFESTPAIPEATWEGSSMLSELDSKIELTMEANQTDLKEGESMVISFSTPRSVAAMESFGIEVSLGDEQYLLQSEIVQITEGRRTAEVTLTAVDDDLVEDLMSGTIRLVNLSSGIEWNGDPISFTIESEDEEEVILNTNDELRFGVFPNPTKRFLHIKSHSQINKIDLYTLEGRLVNNYYFINNRLDLNNLDTGVYVLKVIGDKGKISEKLIIKQ